MHAGFRLADWLIMKMDLTVYVAVFEPSICLDTRSFEPLNTSIGHTPVPEVSIMRWVSTPAAFSSAPLSCRRRLQLKALFESGSS